MKRTLLTLGLSAMLAMPLLASGQQAPSTPGMGGGSGGGSGSSTRMEQHEQRGQQQLGQQSMNQEQIRQAQQRLKEAGFDPGPIDGHFGPQTQAALREFQSAHGLPETGQLDQSTRARLMDQEMGGSPGRTMPGARPSNEPRPSPSTPGGVNPGR